MKKRELDAKRVRRRTGCEAPGRARRDVPVNRPPARNRKKGRTRS